MFSKDYCSFHYQTTIRKHEIRNEMYICMEIHLACLTQADKHSEEQKMFRHFSNRKKSKQAAF